MMFGKAEEKSRQERSQFPLRHGLGPRITRKSGYGYQRVNGRTYLYLSPAYVKIYGPDGTVIDRALTVKRALERIRKLEEQCHSTGPIPNERA